MFEKRGKEIQFQHIWGEAGFGKSIEIICENENDPSRIRTHDN